MSWFNTEGVGSQFFIWSKTQFVRNLASVPFCEAGEAYSDAFKKVGDLLTQNGFRMENIRPGISTETMAFAEKQFVGRDLIYSDRERALFLNDPCSLAIAIGGDNFISIRSLLSGRAINESFNIASGAEELLDGELEFAYSERFGYLAKDPKDCGSASEISAALFLPALSYPHYRESTIRACTAFGASITPFSVYKDNPGDIYLISYKLPPNRAEGVSVSRFCSLCDKLVQNEKDGIRILFSDKRKLIIDKAWRAFGLISFAKSLCESEFLSLLSDIRLGLAVTDDKSLLPPVGISQLNSLLAYGLNASVVSEAKVCASEEECDEARAIITAKLTSSAKQ